MASDAGERARKALLEDGLPEEAITVNQRALIDKILARYSAEWTVFRELVQNADDAGATCCELRFESVKAKAAPSITSGATSPDTDDSVAQGASKSLALSDFKAPLEKWIFKNDGKPFGNDDWSRLRVSGFRGTLSCLEC